MIDARIPLGVQQFSLADLASQIEGAKAAEANREFRTMQMEQLKAQNQGRQTLASLLPAAVQGDKAAMQQIAQVGTPEALQWYEKLDERSRAAEKEKVKDMVAATRWANTPEKWEQVKGYYRNQGVAVPDLPFEAREQVMMELGQIGAYMESAPKLDIRATEPGGGLYGVDPLTGATKVLVQPNAGDAAFGQPAVQEGATATNPQTGEKIIFRNGQWQSAGGSVGNGAGGF